MTTDIDHPNDHEALDALMAAERRDVAARTAHALKEHRMQPLSLAERHSHASLEVRAVRAEAREADFVCSTDSIDSHGTRLRQDWDLKRYLANPVVLFAHESRELPIGQAKNVRVEGGRLLATVRFSDVHARAVECFKLVQEGTLRGISVGFRFGDYAEEKTASGDSVIVLKDLELVELSITPTPSNADCIAKIRSRSASPVIPPAPIPPPRAPVTIDDIDARLRRQAGIEQSDHADLRAHLDSLKSPEERALDAEFDRIAAEPNTLPQRAPRHTLTRNARGEIVTDQHAADLAEFNRSQAEVNAINERLLAQSRGGL